MTFTSKHLPRRPRGRPARLSREMLVDAALAVGVDTLTMSQVADYLGVAKSSLYGWVRSREELLGLVSDVVVERILPGPAPVDSDWRAWLVDLAYRMRREFLAVPGYAAHIAAPHEHHSDAHLRLQHTVISSLTGCGLTGKQASQTCQLLLTAVVGWLVAESHWSGWSDGPRFDLFIDSLIRSMPPQDPPLHRPR